MKILFSQCPSLVMSSACAFLLAGCGGGGGTNSGPGSLSASTPSGLTAAVAQDRSAVNSGGTVDYTLTLRNGTSSPITVQEYQGPYDTQPQFPGYLDINNTSGITVYTTSEPYTGAGLGASGIYVPNPPPPTGHNVAVIVAAGQSLAASFSVSAFTSTGQYTATAVFVPGGAEDLSAPRTSVGPLTVTAQ